MVEIKVGRTVFTKADFEAPLRQLLRAEDLVPLLNRILLEMTVYARYGDIAVLRPPKWSDEELENYFAYRCRPAQLRFFADTTNDVPRRVKRFSLPKKHGGRRDIVAPYGRFKDILRALNTVLQTYDEPTPWAYGFVRGRSVADNAKQHLGQRYVLNMDLKDFFPSIRRAQVEDSLRKAPFRFSSEAVRLVSGLCTVKSPQGDCLAQGFPTSPMLSNIVCRELDEALAQLAESYGVRYTRYADDMTFSAQEDVLRTEGRFARQVQRIVEDYGFRINAKKTHLQRHGRRQVVTGVVVSDKINVSREYLRSIRTLLYVWQRYGYKAACKVAYRHEKPRQGSTKHHHGHINLKAVLKGRLAYMRMIRGAEDEVYLRFMKQYKSLMFRDKSVIQESVSIPPVLTTEKDSWKSCITGRMGLILLVALIIIFKSVLVTLFKGCS